MSEYDYLNARIRGMSSQLLTAEFYNQVLAVGDYDMFIDSLLNSPYGPLLRESLTVERGPNRTESALRRSLFQVFDTVRLLAPPRARKLLSVQFFRWDVRNVQAIIRGKLSEAPREDIVSALFPAGELDEPRLLKLVEEPSAANVADTLMVWGFPLADRLRQALAGRREPIEAACHVELALAESFFAWALNELSGRSENEMLIRVQLQRQIDLVNVMGILQVIRQRETGKAPERIDPVPGGRMNSALLAVLDRCRNIESALEQLASTYFGPGVKRGILAFGSQRQLGAIERFLERVVIEHGCKLFRAYPLGIGVAAGYVWRKFNEFLNLRILLRGKFYGRPAMGIREELFIA